MRLRCVVPILLVFVLFGSKAIAGEQPRYCQIALFFDFETERTLVEISAMPGEEVLAQCVVNGRLPSGYSAEGNSLVPTTVLGQLRDGLANRGAPESQFALAWVRELMGNHADAPAAQIPPIVLSELLGDEKSYWCGTKTFPDLHCPSDCTPTDNPKTCSGCGCAGEATFRQHLLRNREYRKSAAGL